MINELRAAISPFHRRFPSRTYRVAAQVDRRMAVSREARFVFFRVPKAANSTVTATLYAKLAGDLSHDPTGSSKSIKRYFPRGSRLSASEVDGLAREFHLFTFVRNPYSRLASAYLEKVFNAPPHFRARRMLHRFYRREPGEAVSFVEFCRFIDAGGLYQDAHWFPQVTFMPMGVSMLHFIGRVERLTQDLGQVYQHLFGEPLPQVMNKVGHATGASERTRALYDAESAAIVQKHYLADFEQLGYPLEPPWAD